MTRVVVLRPEPGASETMARARALGLDAVSLPLFAVEPVAWDVPDPGQFDALLLTSANAIRHGGGNLARLRHLPAYAVGEATAAAARAAGFQVAAVGDGGAEQLLGAIDPATRLLHPCGEDRAATAATTHRMTHAIAYRARPIQTPDLAAVDGVIALVHSPRAGRRLAELVRERSRVTLAAISEAAATAAGSGWRYIAVAERPSDEALLALAARLCNKPGA